GFDWTNLTVTSVGPFAIIRRRRSVDVSRSELIVPACAVQIEGNRRFRPELALHSETVVEQVRDRDVWRKLHETCWLCAECLARRHGVGKARIGQQET